jgi:hypothetical protein
MKVAFGYAATRAGIRFLAGEIPGSRQDYDWSGWLWFEASFPAVTRVFTRSD